jgi:hypothetical protein
MSASGLFATDVDGAHFRYQALLFDQFADMPEMR